MKREVALIDRLIDHYSPGKPGENDVLGRGWGDNTCAGYALYSWGEAVTMSPDGIAKCLGINDAQATCLFYVPASKLSRVPALQAARKILAEIRESMVAQTH